MSFFEKINFLIIGFTRPILVLLVIYIGFLLFGSLCFIMFESNNEIQARNEKMKIVQKIQAMVKMLREANYNDSLIKKVFFHEHQKKMGVADPQDIPWYQRFGEKFFFSFILASTIGFGNVTPKTLLGKCFCVLYATFGIPIHAVMMRLISVEYRKWLAETFKVGLKLFPKSQLVLIISGFLFFLLMSTIFLFLPSWLIVVIEDGFDYIQAFYFSWVSTSTIGLGDYVAGGVTKSDMSAGSYALNIILTVLWLLFASGFVVMALSMISYVMSVYTLDKFDLKCRPRTKAMQQFKDLLDLMRELNWQLVKGKPEDFEEWSEIEDFKDLLAESPEDVTPLMLNRMFEIILDLKEKAYNQVYKTAPTELAEVPASFIRRHTIPDEESIPKILSTTSIKVNKLKFKDEDTQKAFLISKMASESPGTPKRKEDRDVSSYPNVLNLDLSEQKISRVSPEQSTDRSFRGIGFDSIIEDRRDTLNQENEDDAEDENFDKTDEKSDDSNKRSK